MSNLKVFKTCPHADEQVNSHGVDHLFITLQENYCQIIKGYLINLILKTLMFTYVFGIEIESNFVCVECCP